MREPPDGVPARAEDLVERRRCVLADVRHEVPVRGYSRWRKLHKRLHAYRMLRILPSRPERKSVSVQSLVWIGGAGMVSRDYFRGSARGRRRTCRRSSCREDGEKRPPGQARAPRPTRGRASASAQVGTVLSRRVRPRVVWKHDRRAAQEDARLAPAITVGRTFDLSRDLLGSTGMLPATRSWLRTLRTFAPSDLARP